jgi:hypothetical protein
MILGLRYQPSERITHRPIDLIAERGYGVLCRSVLADETVSESASEAA